MEGSIAPVKADVAGSRGIAVGIAVTAGPTLLPGVAVMVREVVSPSYTWVAAEATG